ALAQLAREAVVQAVKAGFLRVAQVEVGEGPPHRHGRVAHQWLADAAEPAHEAREREAWHAVGEQEVQVFAERQAAQLALHEAGWGGVVLSRGFHRWVIRGPYKFGNTTTPSTPCPFCRLLCSPVRCCWSGPTCTGGCSCRAPSTVRSRAIRAWPSGWRAG